jgi:hypothetical protein
VVIMSLVGVARLLFAVFVSCALARTHASPPPPPPRLETETRVVLPPRQSNAALTPAERDSLLREVTTRRGAWRARQINDYDLVVAVGCFCPWPSSPAIIEVRHGAITALRDTLGKSLGAVREPWSLYSVEGLFDAAEQGIQRDDVIQIAYDTLYDYPAMIRGDAKLGLPDDWFWIRASRLTPRQR